MEQLSNHGDRRQVAGCAYCGDDTPTRDHVPSRVLLDEPFPKNLPVVPACGRCNGDFSIDEEYVACLIDCALTGTTTPSERHRDKVRRILSQKPALAARLTSAWEEADGLPRFSIEDERVRNVVLKLARGHALFELNEQRRDAPSSVMYAPLSTLPKDIRDQFEREPSLSAWPEVGTRTMQRAAINDGKARWVIVQSGRYRYLAIADDTVMVRMVLSEYLACEVAWTCG